MPGGKNQRSALYFYARDYGDKNGLGMKEAIEACYTQ